MRDVNAERAKVAKEAEDVEVANVAPSKTTSSQT